ncbi:hypothetical protein VNI00_013981 [Paramarasmius palmivorus]|uniref:Uncharacterized protein n=1 Tax=Paramarasmius palmivorus TaxID=297713 RepID=A0AAW0BVQ0_9AGAR
MFALPTPNAFVVVQLDPEDSVAHLNNPALTEACRKLRCKKYLAHVGLRDGLFWPDVPYYSYEFYFVHQGLKYKDELGQEVDPGMCVPVLPNTSHPSGRPPLNPVQHLPWDDCYVSPFFAIHARSRNVILDEKPPMLLEVGIDDAVRLSGYVNKDRQDLAERLQQPEQQQEHFGPNHCCCSDHESDVGSPGGDEWNPTGEMKQLAELGELIDEFDEIDAEMMELAALTTSFDLNELDEVTDPAEFFEEMKAFEELKENLVASRKQREIEDARKIDEAYFSKLSQPADGPSAIPAQMTRLTPKDSNLTVGTGLVGKVTQTVRNFMKFFYS